MCQLGKLFAARSRNKSGVWQLNGKFMEGATRPRQPLWYSYNAELERGESAKNIENAMSANNNGKSSWLKSRLHPLAQHPMRWQRRRKILIQLFISILLSVEKANWMENSLTRLTMIASRVVEVGPVMRRCFDVASLQTFWCSWWTEFNFFMNSIINYLSRSKAEKILSERLNWLFLHQILQSIVHNSSKLL